VSNETVPPMRPTTGVGVWHRPTKATVQNKVFLGVSAQVAELLARHDGTTRSLTVRRNGLLLKHEDR